MGSPFESCYNFLHGFKGGLAPAAAIRRTVAEVAKAARGSHT